MIVLLSSCSIFKKNKKTVNNQKANTEAVSVENLIAANEWQPNFFRSKAKIKYEGPLQKGLPINTVGADIRMKKDELVWVSISVPLIGEVARALITPDSVKVINRFQKQYALESIDYLEKLVNYPLDFANLQNILLGNRLEFGNIAPKITANERGYNLQSKNGSLKMDIAVDSSQYFIQKMSVKDTIDNKQLRVALSDYEPINNKAFSHNRQITAQAKANEIHHINLKMNKITINDTLKFPFSINKKYQQMRY